MLNFKVFLFSVFFSLNANFLYSQNQTDSIEIEKDTTVQTVQLNKIMPRKRGVYKTYEEYVNNSPSIEVEFIVTPLLISKNNPLIAEAEVEYKDNRPKKIWGVCDGEYVYIRVMVGSFFKNHYFRLQCDGPSPYIFFIEKPVFLVLGAGSIAFAAVAGTSVALPPFVSISIVRNETNYMKPILLATDKRVKNYLKEYPDLLEAFENEKKHNKATKAKYLTMYNNRKLGK